MLYLLLNLDSASSTTNAQLQVVTDAAVTGRDGGKCFPSFHAYFEPFSLKPIFMTGCCCLFNCNIFM